MSVFTRIRLRLMLAIPVPNHSWSGRSEGFSNLQHFWWGTDTGNRWLAGVPLDVPQYLVHHGGIGDETDYSHLGPTVRAQERILSIDLLDELGPPDAPLGPLDVI